MFSILEIEVQTADVSAEGNIDYASLTRDIVFAEGETEYKFTIPIYVDYRLEQGEVFEVRLLNIEGGMIGYPPTANVFIENDDGEL